VTAFALLTACLGGSPTGKRRHTLSGMALAGLATKPDGTGGRYTMRFYEDHTAEMWHQPSGGQAYCLIGKQIMWRVRAAMAERGITEDTWTPR
jgi:hypothetical protein